MGWIDILTTLGSLMTGGGLSWLISWKLNKNVVVVVKWISKLKPIVASSLKIVLARFAEEYAAETVRGLNDQARQYFNLTGDCEFLSEQRLFSQWADYY